MDPLYTIRQDADPMDYDLLVVSINSTGAPGALNRAVMKRAGYPEEELPDEGDLRSGYFLLNRPDHKPILFIVVNPEDEVREQLPYNLYNGLLTYRDDLRGKRVWLPLLGTGAGRMAYAESFALTMRVIESLVGETRSEPPQFIISVPGTEEGLALLKEHGVVPAETSGEEQNDHDGEEYWLIKMGPTWNGDMLAEDSTIFFQPKDYNGKPLEVALQQPIGRGDRALAFLAGVRVEPNAQEGYPGDYLWCEMIVERVTKPAFPFEVQLRVVRTFRKPIPRHQFAGVFPLGERSLNLSRPYEEIILLPEDTYHAILTLEEQPFTNSLLPFYLTEGNHRATEDQLGFEADIDSFATVICLEAVKPPLAIGLFGNWGSGKSFFMAKLEDRIEQLTQGEERVEAGSGSPGFVKHVVPVRFNSWHYSDANLWASMILHIFESLNAYAAKTKTPQEAIQGIYAQLNVTKTQIAETQKALDEKVRETTALESQKESVERMLEEKRRTLGLWSVGEIGRIVIADPFVQEDIRTLEAQFDTKNLGENLGELKKRLEEAKGAGTQIRAAWKDAQKYSRGRWLWVWLVVLLAGAACLIVFLFFREEMQGFIDSLAVPLTVLASGASGLAAKLAPHFKKANGFYQSLKGLVTRIEAKKSKLELQQGDIKANLEASIRELTAQRDSLEQQKTQAEAEKAALEEELADIGSGRRLAAFLAGKSADDTYLRQLGIISWIRKDFEQLDRHFEEQREARKAGKTTDAAQLQIDRIVLYIDDLDRCNQDVVVKVLEAIHLLLAFPLFVVVVGVDPRWLHNALKKKHSTLFGAAAPEDSAEEAETPTGAASPYDYLEKIFQIPFALKPMTKTGREKLIQYLVKDELEAEKKEGSQAVIAQKEADASQGEDAPPQQTSSISTDTKAPAMATPAASQPRSSIAVPASKAAKEKLFINAEELAFMQQLSPLFAGTPRTVNRYVNIYRIIKAHGGLQVAGPYERDEFLPILFLLAIVVGFPEYADGFLSRLQEAKDTDKCSDFLDNCGIGPLREKATPLIGALGEMHVRYLKKNLPLVARFSFRTLMRDLG